MDRTVDGGMAPALQSCNYQSSGLVNQEVEGTKEEDVVPHEKVNGSVHADDFEVPVNYSETSSSIADAAGDNDNRLYADIGSTPATADTCILTGLEDTQPTIPMPAIHIGQGDSAVQNVMNYNGWGDCKRVNSGGILQESKNISSAHTASKGSNKKVVLTKSDSIGDSTDKTDKYHLNGNLRNILLNGDSTPCSPSPVLQSRMQIAALSSSVVNPVKYSAACSSNFTTISSLPGKDCTETLLLSSSGTAADCPVTVANHRHDQNISSPSPVVEVGKGFGAPHQEPKALDYTDLLSSDLSKINMSDKLANTLHELAASLKGTNKSSNTEATTQVASSEPNYTVNVEGRDLLGRSVKGLDFSITHLPDDGREKEKALKDQRLSVEMKHRTVVYNAGILSRRLNALKKGINAMRSCAVGRHATKEICGIASFIPSSDTNIKFGSDQAAGSGNQQKTLCCDEFSEFWPKLFQNNVTQMKKLSESEVPATRKRIPSKVLTENDKTPLKEEIGGERKLSGELIWIDLDPYIQLTRVEDLKNQANMTQDIASLAKVSAGILQKELKFVRSLCDPELTESSSDEDITEPLISKPQKWKALKSAAKSSTRTKFRKSFCKWVAERAEISRRWTWLQSRISSLELNIRRQGDLYSQLRDNKGAVQLDSDRQQIEGSSLRVPTDDVAWSTSIPVAISPCNVNTLVDNVHNQTSRLFNNLPPLSGGSSSVSQSQPLVKPSQPKDLSTASTATNIYEAEDLESTCARVKQLHLDSFQNRKLVKITPTILASEGQKSQTVPNDSFLMCIKQDPVGDGFAKCTSLILKAALHDHSYHAVISAAQDIPLSISIRAVMKSKRRWCKNSSSHKHENKVSRKQKRKKRRKSKKKYKRSSNFASHAEDSKRRKLSNQVSNSGRKRPKDSFVDSDLDSRATTPTSEITGQSQNYLKKRKTSEQAYDINNIVIPHGLNSARIEKLAYKEIQTPSWRMLELSPTSETEQNQLDSEIPDFEEEDTSSLAFQCRHDNNEIIEKRKYMAFMEWSISRRGRGSRMGKIREPSTPDPESPSPLAYTPSPVSFAGEPFSITTLTSMATSVQSPATVATSPTAEQGVTTRRMSSDQPGTPPSLHQHPADTSLSYSFSSPSLALWQDGFGSRHISNDNAAPINRTISDGANTCKNDQPNSRTWEMRTFPLSDESIRLLEDVEYAKVMLNVNGTSPDRLQGPDTEDGNSRHSVIRLVSSEKYQTDHTRPASQDPLNLKIIAAKRRTTDSRASSLASYDDTARHSDCSNASASSVRKNRKKLGFVSPPVQRKHDNGRGKGPLRRMNSSINSKHKYLDIRLSETDASTNDSDSDSNSSDEDSSGSFDDAGHVVDDFADPEWECPRPRERR